ncbi:MAG: RsmE family RNA methyltransferase [Gemmataceae bacterium]
MADRFYTSSALAPGPAVLQGAEAHHLATVRRFRPGDRVVLFNGDGHEYAAEIVGGDRKSVALQVLGVESPPRELPFRLEIAAALPKGDRGDFLIEKLTELGVTDFVPLRTDRSVVHPAKLDRLRRAVIEASKQCGRNVLMRVHELVAWEDYCRRSGLPARRWLGHMESAEGIGLETGASGLCAAVGPEGGFTAGEVALAGSAGWRLVSLGPCVLRVETAAMKLAILAVALST